MRVSARWCGFGFLVGSRRSPPFALSCDLGATGVRRRGAASVSSVSLCVLLDGPRVELESDDRFAADDPGVVPWLDHIRLAGTDLLFGAVFVDDMHGAGLQESDVVGLAALAARDRLMHSDHLRPGSSRSS